MSMLPHMIETSHSARRTIMSETIKVLNSRTDFGHRSGSKKESAPSVSNALQDGSVAAKIVGDNIPGVSPGVSDHLPAIFLPFHAPNPSMITTYGQAGRISRSRTMLTISARVCLISFSPTIQHTSNSGILQTVRLPRCARGRTR
jgi:hypothetical protein